MAVLRHARVLAVVFAAVLLGLFQMANRKYYPPPQKGGAVLVTGASTGIGRHSSIALAKQGFVVFAAVRNPAHLDEDYGPGSVPLLLDVLDSESIEKAAEKVEDELKRREIPLVGLVNNAGIGSLAPMEFEPLEYVRKVFDTNVFGLLAVTQRFLPMIRRSKGRIVNVSSAAGLVAGMFSGTYSGSKHAVEAFTDAMRMELAPLGVSVSSLNPGFVETDILTKLRQHLKYEAFSHPQAKELYNMGDIFRKNLETVLSKAAPTTVTDDAIAHALTSPYPKTRYIVANVNGLPTWIYLLPKYFLPDRIYDTLAATIDNFELYERQSRC